MSAFDMSHANSAAVGSVSYRWGPIHRPGVRSKAVIVTSAEQGQAAHELCRELPFLQKPYDFDDVAARIAAVTRRAA